MKLRWLLLGVLTTLLLVPALLLTTARMLDLPGGTWVRLVAFTPYALPLHVGALVLLVLAWWRGRGFWRAAARLLVVVPLLGVALHAVWAAGPYVGTPGAQAAGTHRLNVMTSNLRFGQASAARVVEVAVAARVDVLVLQEVTPQAISGLEGAGLGQALPHRAGAAAEGAAGTMVFSRFPLRHVKKIGTTFGGYAMDMRTPAGRVHLIAAHPQPPVGDVARWRFDHGVLRHAALATADRTMIVGDLNATMDHLPMRALVGIGFEDAATQADSRWQPTWPAAGAVSRLGIPVPPLVTIDHVLLSSDLRALRTESVTVQGSDHRALVAAVGL